MARRCLEGEICIIGRRPAQDRSWSAARPISCLEQWGFLGHAYHVMHCTISDSYSSLAKGFLLFSFKRRRTIPKVLALYCTAFSSVTVGKHR
ncbi:uncharacterized protein BDR25DRAFT_358846 [Lindgomyces ingoldianus]|uniref:Uncharacterized protein n=1 Tax=Lindgomyces ingoldianus TaxID=673940 RepID=A0ACB6QK30_9PLEO|nr:uncharacterized protein BDR25DRAFT_358846 [Lindgomyces ingoldianus]KAF2467298.1 hypothetical protein BDR25DRAFT_358846 [Lindgomyces ingoldianus]